MRHDSSPETELVPHSDLAYWSGDTPSTIPTTIPPDGGSTNHAAPETSIGKHQANRGALHSRSKRHDIERHDRWYPHGQNHDGLAVVKGNNEASHLQRRKVPGSVRLACRYVNANKSKTPSPSCTVLWDITESIFAHVWCSSNTACRSKRRVA